MSDQGTLDCGMSIVDYEQCIMDWTIDCSLIKCFDHDYPPKTTIKRAPTVPIPPVTVAFTTRHRQSNFCLSG